MHETMSGFWQSLASLTIGVLVTLIGFWAGMGRKIVVKKKSPR